MSTSVTPAPATPSPVAALTSGQASAVNAFNKFLSYLTPATQGVVGALVAAQQPNQNGFQEGVSALMALTAAATTAPNQSVEFYSSLALAAEQVVATTIGTIEQVTTPAQIVPNAKPSIVLKIFHPNIAKQEEALAAQAAAAAKAAGSPVSNTTIPLTAAGNPNPQAKLS